MKKRCIMIFPEFKNMKIINEIREKYDPLANNVRSHVTLVFPFESELTTEELKENLQEALKGIRAFELKLQHIIRVDDFTGKYLFLSLKKGLEQVKEIHKKLYEGKLQIYKPEWLGKVEFMPHVTLGNFTDSAKLDQAYKETQKIDNVFSTVVEKISVEIIDENEDSILELEVALEKN